MQRQLLALAGAALALLAGCDLSLVVSSVSMSPLPPGATVHFVNSSANAVIVGSSLLEADRNDDRLMRPCGGTLSVPASELTTDDGRLLIMLLIDDTGRLDRELGAWAGDPADLPGSFSVTIAWSRGDIPPADLPKWITISAEGVEVTASPPPAQASPVCAPWEWI